MTANPAAFHSSAAKLAVAYLRVSTDKQPLSIADQRRTIQEWADKNKVTIVRWYEDEAKSGASGQNRAQFQKMMSEVERRKDVAFVLCYDVSRFGRTDTDEAGFYRFRLRQVGTEVVYVAETAVNGSETDDLLLPVLQFQKREYLRSLSRDTLRGSIGLAKRGAWCGGPVPFGYARELRDRDGKPIKVLARGERAMTEDGSSVFLVPGEAREIEAVRLAWDLHWTERVGIDTIRDRIVAMGVPPPRGPMWRSTSIRAMFLNPIYTGRASYGVRTQAKFYRVTKEGAVARTKADSGVFVMDPAAEPIVIEGAHPTFVSPVAANAFRAWEAADRERRRRREPYKKRNRFALTSTFVLTGVTRCGRCGYRFIGSTRRRKGHAYPEYVCGGYQASGKALCPRFPVPQDIIEARVFEEIRRRWQLGRGLDAVRARVEEEIERMLAPAGDDEIRALKRELAALDERMLTIVQNLSAAHADLANAALDRLKAERAPLQERLRGIESLGTNAERLESAAPVMAALIVRLDEVLRTGSLPDRKAVLRGFVREIVIHPAESAADVMFWGLPETIQAPPSCLNSKEPGSLQLVAGVRFGSYTPNAPMPVKLSSPPAHPHVRFKITMR